MGDPSLTSSHSSFTEVAKISLSSVISSVKRQTSRLPGGLDAEVEATVSTGVVAKGRLVPDENDHGRCV